MWLLESRRMNLKESLDSQESCEARTEVGAGDSGSQKKMHTRLIKRGVASLR